MIRAVVYTRVSTPRQGEEEKASLTEQEHRCRQYCQGKGYTVVAIYSDISSGATKKRPRFQEMLKQAQAGKFDIIVAWKADRLARGIYPSAALFEALENTSITIETVAEPFDRTTFEVRAVLARTELESIAQRTQVGREGNIKRGNHHIRPPFGYDYDLACKRWVINELEARWVRQIFEWYIDGIPVHEISRRLNNAGVPTKKQSRLGWTAQKISELVNSECYAGVAYYNKRKGGSNKVKDKSHWVEMSVPPIISRETWEAAHNRRASNKRWSPRNTQQIYLTQHTLICEECGYPFYIDSNRGKARLMCGGMRMYPHLFNCRQPKTMPEHRLGERLWEGVAGVLGSEEALETAVLSRAKQVATEREPIERRLKQLTKTRNDLKLEQERVITGFRKGFYSEKQLNRQLRAIRAEDEQYAAEEDRLLADLKLHGDAQAVYQEARQLIPSMRERLNDRLRAEEKRDIIKLLIRRALIDKDGNMTIGLKVPVPERGFGYATSPHGGSPHCSQGLGDAHGCAIGWT